MLGQISGRAESRYFRYEVAGCHQSEQTDGNNYEIRSSSSLFFTVPYARMNEEMQRISRLGGKIVSIKSLDLAAPAPSSKSANSSEG
jgi:phycocyanin-associated, rod